MEIIICEIMEELPTWLTSAQREIAESIIEADVGEVVIIARRCDGDVQVFEEMPDPGVFIALLKWAAGDGRKVL